MCIVVRCLGGWLAWSVCKFIDRLVYWFVLSGWCVVSLQLYFVDSKRRYMDCSGWFCLIKLVGVVVLSRGTPCRVASCDADSCRARSWSVVPYVVG